MTRRARSAILYDHCYVHIFSRSIEKRFIFKTDLDFRTFKQQLSEAKREGRFHLFHYCLMHTHFHLAVGLGAAEEFSKAMKWLKRQYTLYYNKACKRRGAVWQGRFSSLVIEDARYLRACGVYIEDNPVKAGLVRRADEWGYSSARYYHARQPDELVDPYEWDGGAAEIDADQEQFFERGSAVGSPIFRLQAREAVSDLTP